MTTVNEFSIEGSAPVGDGGLAPQVPAESRQFLKGPINWHWLVRAGRLKGKTLHVAVCLCRQMGLRKSRTFPFTRKRATQMGMSIDSVKRAMRRLERAGLIRISRRPGSASVVELVGAEVPRRRITV